MNIPVEADVDVLVVGAGSAGCTAAIAAAEGGARTLLIERSGFLGGTSTGVLDTFYGFYTPGVIKKVVGGIPDRIVRDLENRKAAFLRPNTFGSGTGVTYNPEMLKIVWEQQALAAGVRLLMHVLAIDIVVSDDGRQVHEVSIASKQGLRRIRARQIIDASGDADIVALAGSPFERAGDIEAAQTLTTTFRLANVDTAIAAKVPRKELHRLMREANASGNYHLPREEGSIHRTPIDGVMLAIMTRMDGYDPLDINSLTAAEVEGRLQALEYIRFLVDQVPGYQRASLVALGTQTGVRETRRIIGEYRLTAEDVYAPRKFADTIGQCGAPVEDHHGGSDTKWVYIPNSGVYDIPFRTLIPVGLDNVLVAGRCFSATHEAHASCRSIAQCMAMGQAAGTAAALAIRHDANPRDLDLGLLQDRLVTDGAVLYDEQQVVREVA